MKVLFIIPGEETGNSMIFAKRQIKFLTSQQVDCSSFFLKSRSNPFIIVKEFLRFRKLYRSIQPDLVHSHYGTATAFFAAVSHSRPLVITYHGSDLNYLENENIVKEFFAKLLSQLASLRASAIICVSDKLKKKLWWRKKVVSVLPMGVDETFFKPFDYSTARRELGITPDEKIILFNYGNAPVKRLDIAEATAALVKNKFPQSRLWVLKGNTTQETMVLLLNGSDCLLLCSNTEGAPTIVKEAMACNLPVVSTDVGDVRRNLEKTFPHFVCDQNPEQLAKGVNEILALHIRSNGRESLARLGITEESLCRKLIGLYNSLMKK